MFEIIEEKVLMVSSDNSVKLTTHRIIYESGKGRKQIMLEDFKSYELKSSFIGAYGILFSIFIGLTVLIAANKIINFISYRGTFIFYNNIFEFFWDDKGFLILLVLLIVVYFFYLISRRYYIKINGKDNSIEFRVTSLRNPSISKMLEKMLEQSDKLKNVATIEKRKEN